MGLLARFFNGSLPWSELWLMEWSEIEFYYNIFDLQTTEEEVVQEWGFDKKTGEKKKLPPFEKIREETNRRIAERKNNG